MYIQWCSFCNKKPAEGILTVEDTQNGEHIPLPSCEECAKAMYRSENG